MYTWLRRGHGSLLTRCAGYAELLWTDVHLRLSFQETIALLLLENAIIRSIYSASCLGSRHMTRRYALCADNRGNL
eukprot:ANDGO_04342.mRNA.1 hypothetical protein